MNRQVVALATNLMLVASSQSIAGSGCDTQSGPNTAALIELYTSEGCSSCPPADKQLGRLPQMLDPAAEAVPLALHVDYWDYLGWKDRFAQPRFALRQDWLARANHRRAAYTPQFFVAGAEIQIWKDSLRDSVRRLNAKPASATISLHATLSGDNVLTLDAKATTRADDDATALYLAVAENGLETRVKAGENKDSVLAHDHVAREWLGPFRLNRGTIRARQEIKLPTAWQRDRLETIAFVQDEHTGSVLQAVRAAPCPGT